MTLHHSGTISKGNYEELPKDHLSFAQGLKKETYDNAQDMMDSYEKKERPRNRWPNRWSGWWLYEKLKGLKDGQNSRGQRKPLIRICEGD